MRLQILQVLPCTFLRPECWC